MRHPCGLIDDHQEAKAWPVRLDRVEEANRGCGPRYRYGIFDYMSGTLRHQRPGEIDCADVRPPSGLSLSAIAPAGEQRAPDFPTRVLHQYGTTSVANTKGRMFQRPKSFSMSTRAKAKPATQLESVQGEVVPGAGSAVHDSGSRIARIGVRRRARCFRSRGGNKGGSSPAHAYACSASKCAACLGLPHSL